VGISSDRLGIEQAVRSGSSLRQAAQLYGLSASSLARHAQHGPPEPSSPVTRTHTTDAEEVIAAVRVLRGLDWTAQDQAEAGQLLSLAGAVDADRTNVAALREFRLTLAGFRQGSFRPDPTEQMELAELIASISGPPPDAWQKAFDAAVAAGVPLDAAGNVASAATDRNYDPHPPQTPEEWHARKRSCEAAIADYQRTGHYERKAQHNDRFT
jgi:transposase-like protein